MAEDDPKPELKTRIRRQDTDSTRIYEPSRQHRAEAAATGAPEIAKPARKRGRDATIDIGTTIAKRFVLEKLLGQGGMSVVYRARDLIKERQGDPNPHIAIKILRTNFADTPEAVTALQRETKKAQMLAHPHIVTVHHFEIDRKLGLPFVLMEELQGQSLRHLIDGAPKGLSDIKKAVSIILSIADGLEYAHKRGIVHSDLKPSNVFITDKGDVKILDFGIARAMPGTDTDQFDVGSLGALTPGYATSEMFDGEPPDPADDIYALGLIAHELLTGSHPYLKVLGEDEPIKAACELGLKPKRIKSIKRRQWHTLASSLAFERASRPRDAGIFLRQFRRRSNLSLYLGSVLLVLALVLIYEIYTTDELAPEVPFKDLPVETRDAFNRAVEEGNTAYQFKDFNGALHYFGRAYEIHPYNPRAMEGLDKIVERVTAQKAGDSRAQLESQLHTVQILLSHDVLAERSDLKEREKVLQKLLIQ